MDWIKLEKFGCGLRMDKCVLINAPMLKNGELDLDEGVVGPVECFDVEFAEYCLMNFDLPLWQRKYAIDALKHGRDSYEKN